MSAAGRDVTSPADTRLPHLRGLIEDAENDTICRYCEEWDESNIYTEDAKKELAAVLALIDAAQDTVDNANLVCDEEILLDRALRALSEPRP